MLVVKQAKDEFPHNMPSLADRNNAGGVCKKLRAYVTDNIGLHKKWERIAM